MKQQDASLLPTEKQLVVVPTANWPGEGSPDVCTTVFEIQAPAGVGVENAKVADSSPGGVPRNALAGQTRLQEGCAWRVDDRSNKVTVQAHLHKDDLVSFIKVSD